VKYRPARAVKPAAAIRQRIANRAIRPRPATVTLAGEPPAPARISGRGPGPAGKTGTVLVTAGYLHVGVPQDGSSPRTVTARIVSGELELRSR
jgi:hypothetical protein